MSPRQKRIARVVEHRERRLADTVAELQKSRADHVLAQQLAEQERARLRHAAEYRSELTRDLVQAGDLAEAHSWLDASAVRFRTACQKVARADSTVQRAQSRTLVARNDLKKVELLRERLVRAEQSASDAREHKTHDEHAARMVLERRRNQ